MGPGAHSEKEGLMKKSILLAAEAAWRVKAVCSSWLRQPAPIWPANTIARTALGVVTWAFLGALIGTAGAGLYGILYGALDGLIHADFSRCALAGLYFFALCGAVAGALTGGFVRVIDPEGVADLTKRSPQPTLKIHIVFLKPNTSERALMAGPSIREDSPSGKRSRFKPSWN
jgi:hypothetical protein